MHVGCALRRPKSAGTQRPPRVETRFPASRGEQMAKVELILQPHFTPRRIPPAGTDAVAAVVRRACLVGRIASRGKGALGAAGVPR